MILRICIYEKCNQESTNHCILIKIYRRGLRCHMHNITGERFKVYFFKKKSQSSNLICYMEKFTTRKYTYIVKICFYVNKRHIRQLGFVISREKQLRTIFLHKYVMDKELTYILGPTKYFTSGIS